MARLYRVVKPGFAAECWECNQWLLMGEYVYRYFGGMAIVHARCVDKDEVVYLPLDKPLLRVPPNRIAAKHVIRESINYHIVPEKMYPTPADMPRICETPWPEPVCTCEEYRLEWEAS